jgi:hypothetical protein
MHEPNEQRGEAGADPFPEIQKEDQRQHEPQNT